jgi:hypothetical protein
MCRLLQVLKLPAPAEHVACWQFDLFFDHTLCFGHKTSQVTTANVALHQQSTTYRMPTDLDWTIAREIQETG